MPKDHVLANLWHKKHGGLHAWYFKLALARGTLLAVPVLASFTLSLFITTPNVQIALLHVHATTQYTTPHIVCNPDC
jgi:hypothetical protein